MQELMHDLKSFNSNSSYVQQNELSEYPFSSYNHFVFMGIQ